MYAASREVSIHAEGRVSHLKGAFAIRHSVEFYRTDDPHS